MNLLKRLATIRKRSARPGISGISGISVPPYKRVDFSEESRNGVLDRPGEIPEIPDIPPGHVPLAAVLPLLDPEARYLLEERAAILEHDAGYAAAEVERLAWQMLFTNSRN